MTGNLYLGSITTKGAYTENDPVFLPLVERAISVRPAEAEQKGFKYYMDFLYYNRANALGEVLSSLIYVGNFRDSSLDNIFTYNPELLFRHNTAEQYINVQDTDTDFTGFNYIIPQELQPLYSTPVDYEVLVREGKLSNTLGPMDVAFDGWYTLLNVAVTDTDVHDIEGSLQWIDPNNYTPYQSNASELQIDIKDFSDPTLSMGQLPYLSNLYNSYKKQDFFVLYDFKKLYKHEMERNEELKYKAEYNSIIEKGKVLNFLLETKDFLGAQQLLQTVEDSILLNVIA
jgi:hypothetical protein